MSDYKKIAIEAAKEAGDAALRLANKPIKYSMKSRHDIQAEADLVSEKIIIDKIKAAFPTHSILSEEAGEETRETEYLWVIDPIDGTINYEHGIEEYCVSIALSRNGQTLLGVIYQPVRGLLFVAEKGKGAYLNGAKIKVSNETKLVNCLVGTDNTSNLKARQYNLELLTKVADQVRHVRIFGSSALQLVRIAQGQLDFYFKTRYNHWDFAAATLILQEAGGTVTDMEGRPISRDSTTILAGSQAIYLQALDLIKNSSSAL